VSTLLGKDSSGKIEYYQITLRLTSCRFTDLISTNHVCHCSSQRLFEPGN